MILEFGFGLEMLYIEYRQNKNTVDYLIGN